MDPINIDFIVHGTYFKSWNDIKRQGLNKMRRLHVHFAKGLPDNGKVISGMRTTCELIIYLDLRAALSAGLKFYLSENGVILTDGDDAGYVETRFFSKVVDRKSGELIPF